MDQGLNIPLTQDQIFAVRLGLGLTGDALESRRNAFEPSSDGDEACMEELVSRALAICWENRGRPVYGASTALAVAVAKPGESFSPMVARDLVDIDEELYPIRARYKRRSYDDSGA